MRKVELTEDFEGKKFSVKIFHSDSHPSENYIAETIYEYPIDKNDINHGILRSISLLIDSLQKSFSR